MSVLIAIEECCDETRECPGCFLQVCPEHSDAPVSCLRDGLTCRECHLACLSYECNVCNDPNHI